MIDFTLLHLSTPAELNQKVGVLQLPPLSAENSNFDECNAVQAGFGNFGDLKYQNLVMVTSYSSSRFLSGYYRYSLCAVPNSGSDAEAGDAGGPVFYFDNSNGGQSTLLSVHWGMGDECHLSIRTSSFLKTIADIVGVTLRNLYGTETGCQKFEPIG